MYYENSKELWMPVISGFPEFFNVTQCCVTLTEGKSTNNLFEKTMDFVFYLADDSYLHLEFQSTKGPVDRLNIGPREFSWIGMMVISSLRHWCY